MHYTLQEKSWFLDICSSVELSCCFLEVDYELVINRHYTAGVNWYRIVLIKHLHNNTSLV